jgi:cytoskeletal protein CcmA (bactofilin family)
MRAVSALIAIVALVVLVLLVWTTAIEVVARTAGSNVSLLAAPRTSGDLIRTGRTVSIESEIQGDLAAAGSSVGIAGPVRGYAIVAGSEVHVRGDIEDDLWAAGRVVGLHAPVRDNAMLAGASVKLGEQASIGGDAAIAARSVDAGGRIDGDLTIVAEQVELKAEVVGTVTARASRFRLLPGASIGGDLIVRGTQAPELSSDARVLGRVEFHREPGGWAWGPLAWLGQWAFMLLSTLILGGLVMALGATWPERVADQLKRSPARALALGVAATLLPPIAGTLLAITLLGLPAAVALVALWLTALLLAQVFLSYAVGSDLLRSLKRPGASGFVRLLLGATFVSLLTSLPWIGWIAQIAVVVIGLGALVIERMDASRRVLAPEHVGASPEPAPRNPPS